MKYQNTLLCFPLHCAPGDPCLGSLLSNICRNSQIPKTCPGTETGWGCPKIWDQVLLLCSGFRNQRDPRNPINILQPWDLAGHLKKKFKKLQKLLEKQENLKQSQQDRRKAERKQLVLGNTDTGICEFLNTIKLNYLT